MPSRGKSLKLSTGSQQPLELYATVWKDIRFYRVKQFPFLVYYRVRAGAVEVLAVLHGSREPLIWQSRA